MPAAATGDQVWPDGWNASGLVEEALEEGAGASLFPGYPVWMLYLAAACCALFMLVGIPGNLITVAALFRTKKLRNATAVFIMNLSISDLMCCCFNLPLAISTFLHDAWIHGPLLCRLFPLLRYGLVAVSLFTVLAITINRYVMIGHPRLYPKLYKPRYLALMVLATWIGGFGALIPTWFEAWGRFGLDPSIGSCSILQDASGRSPKQFLFILAFIAPCIAIVVCYARIFYIVRKTALKSRRRDDAARELVRSNVEAKCMRNAEDSAIGSMSCQATQTTSSENGGSPLKCELPGLLLLARRASSLRKLSLSRFRPEQPSTGEEDNEELDEEAARLQAGCHVVIPELRLPEVHSGSPGRPLGKLTRSLGQLPLGLDLANGGIGRPEQQSRFLSPPAACRYQQQQQQQQQQEEFSEDGSSLRSNSPSELARPSDLPSTPYGSSRSLRRESRVRSVKSARLLQARETGRMTDKDKKLLKMILVIFSSFIVCYLPITISKTFKSTISWRGLNIAGYILIYLTTCINPVIYVVMSSEYRSAYKNVLLCRSDSASAGQLHSERHKLHRQQRQTANARPMRSDHERPSQS